MRAIRMVLVLCAVVLGTVLNAVPALAHGGPVQLAAGPDGAGGLTVYASYVEDGHPARGLALTATATAGEVDRGPLPLRPAGEGEGFYVLSAGALPAGHWTVTVTGGTAQQVRPATTTVEVAPSPSESAPTGVTPSAPAPTGVAAPKDASASAGGAGRPSGSTAFAGALVALALLGGVSALIVRRRGLRSGLVGRLR